MSAKGWAILGIGLAWVFTVFLTRYLTQREQHALDTAQFAVDVATAKDSVSIEYHQRLTRAITDTLVSLNKQAARTGQRPSPSRTEVCGGTPDTSGRVAPPGDQMIDLDSLPADSATYDLDGGGTIHIEWRGRIDELLYTPSMRVEDSVVIHSFKKIPIEVQPSPLTVGHIAIVSVATIAVIEGLHYLFTRRF